MLDLHLFVVSFLTSQERQERFISGRKIVDLRVLSSLLNDAAIIISRGSERHTI